MSYVLGLFVCALVLLFASKIVYKQVVAVARHLRVPPFLIALVAVALSTSIPELFVGITSAVNAVPTFSLGDILGSNIVNLTFIAGLVVLLGRKKIILSQHIKPKQLIFTFAIASAPVLLLLDGTLSRLDGFILLCLYAIYVAFVVIDHNRLNTEKERSDWKGLGSSLGLFLLGVAILIGTSEAIIYLARGLSTQFTISPFIIGVFAIAFSTSLPELTFGLRSALQKTPELSLGDVIGSSAVNASGILGLVAVIHPITPIALSSVLATGFFGIFVFLAFFLLLGMGKASPIRGAFLLVLYFLFVSFSFLV